MILFGCIISAFSFNIFFSAYEIIPGGVSGVSIILHQIFDFNESLVIAILSLFLLVLGLIFLGKKEILRSILGSIFFSLFAYLSSILISKVDIRIDSRLLASVIGGVAYGFGIGLVYREGYTTGGADILCKIFNKYFHIPIGHSTLVMDAMVAFLGIIVFDFETFMYSIVTITIYSVVIDKTILGISSKKSFYIITSNPDKIKKYIINELHHGVTLLKGKGAYTDEDKYILLVVIPTRDYYKLKSIINEYDKNAFFIVSSSYEVGGGK